jgi:UDPglucose--hexose-1-phosphate uridylyltransferase
MMVLPEHPHRRYNPLTGEWILVSPQRTQRPWQGKVESLPGSTHPSYDPQCYLCPGNQRAGGGQNPQYEETFVFTNDFSALTPLASRVSMHDGDLLRAESESGICRVVCFSPRHNLTLAGMTASEVLKVVQVWTAEYGALAGRDDIAYVQIFENKGDIMGCSNPHPHGQIWAQCSVPVIPGTEQAMQVEYRRAHASCLLCDYVTSERAHGERVVCANDHFLAVVPFWAVWPFETLLLPLRHCSSLLEFSDEEREALADLLRRICVRYDNLFNVSFPYSMGIHQSPTDGLPHPEWHLHFHFYPPLLRSATVRKFMVGYEMMANPQRDITAEVSASRLRESSDQLRSSSG